MEKNTLVYLTRLYLSRAVLCREAHDPQTSPIHLNEFSYHLSNPRRSIHWQEIKIFAVQNTKCMQQLNKDRKSFHWEVDKQNSAFLGEVHQMKWVTLLTIYIWDIAAAISQSYKLGSTHVNNCECLHCYLLDKLCSKQSRIVNFNGLCRFPFVSRSGRIFEIKFST